MKKSKIPLSLSLLLLLIASPLVAAPRLTVVIVIDQFKADYLKSHRDQLGKGIEQLLEEGFLFENTRINHIPTNTGPGHAAIATGQLPSTHGIIGNFWWSHKKKKEIYAVKDRKGRMTPNRLLSATVGDELKEKNKESLVVSLSLKDRAAILMGGKNPDTVIWFDGKKGEFTSSSYYGGTPKWVDPINQQLSKRVDLTEYSKVDRFKTSPASDQELFQLIRGAISQIPLGEDDIPDLLMVSFSGTDYVGHRYGSHSLEMEQQLRNIDILIGQLLKLVHQKAGKDNVAILLTSDHGVLHISRQKHMKADQGMRLPQKSNVRGIEEQIQKIFPLKKEKWIVAWDWPHLYFNQRQMKKKKIDQKEFNAAVIPLLERHPSVAAVYDPNNWNTRRDDYLDLYRRSYHPGRSGDLMLRVQENVLTKSKNTAAGHGSPYDYDAKIPVIMAGPSIKNGSTSKEVKMTDIAPTLRFLLDLPPHPIEGSRVLEKAFKTR